MPSKNSKKILTSDQIAALANLLGVVDLQVFERAVPLVSYTMVSHWNFIGVLMHLATQAGYGLRIDGECAQVRNDINYRYCAQAFHYDGGPTGAADEVRPVESNEHLARAVALCLLDLQPKTGA